MPRLLHANVEDGMAVCPRCGGTCTIPDPADPTLTVACPACNGQGRVTHRQAARLAATTP